MNQAIRPATSPLGLVDGASGVGQRVRGALTSRSSNDRAVATLILRDPFAAAFSTVEQIAAAASVSKAAVARFGMRLGYAGFAELRQDLRNHWQEWAQPARERLDEDRPEVQPATTLASVVALLTGRLAQEVGSLSRLAETIDPAALVRCADLLARPGARVHIFGERRGYAIAAHALRTLHWVGCDARLVHTEELGLRLALDQLGPRHVLLAFAFRRYAHTTGVVIQHARQRGARVILIADSLDCPFAADADELLVCASAGNLLIDSSVPAIFGLEALCDVVMLRLGEQVERHVRRVHEQTPLADFDDSVQTADMMRSRRRQRRKTARHAAPPPTSAALTPLLAD